MRDLAAGQQLAAAHQPEALVGHSAFAQALGMAGDLVSAAGAQAADHLRVVLVVQPLQGQAARQLGALQIGQVHQGHHPGFVEAMPAHHRQAGVQIRWLGEGRDAHDQRQAGAGKGRAAARQHGGQRQMAALQGVDAARPLGLARREPQQPAIDEGLLRRRAGVQAGVLDAARQRGGGRRVTRAQGHQSCWTLRTISRAQST